VRVRVERLLLAEVTFPDWHPRFAEGGCAVFGYVVRHPDGVIVFDTGVGLGNAFIDDLYSPTVVAIDEALSTIGIDERDVVAVVNSHLHFDHCGQNELFHARGVPVYTQAAELETVAADSSYTVPDWAHIPESSRRTVRGDEQLADGVRIVETPGHTPGHQSLVVETDVGRVVLAGQCVYKMDEVADGRVALDNMHDDASAATGQDSLERLLALDARYLVAAHDARPLLPNSR
jgi:N-acyl homoserine lactone hydrolase